MQTLFGTIRGRFSHMHTLEQKAENAVTRLVQEQKLRLEVTRTMKALQTQINDLQGQGQTIKDQKEELDEAKSRLLSFEEELESLCRENACLVKQVAAGSKNLEDLCTQHTAQLTTAQNDLKDARIERTTAKKLAKKQARTIIALEAAAEAAASAAALAAAEPQVPEAQLLATQAQLAATQATLASVQAEFKKKNEELARTTEKEIQAAAARGSCTVCWEPATHMCYPCRHFNMCADCIPIPKCMTCEWEVSLFMEVLRP